MDDAAFHNVSVNSNLTTLVPAGVGTALKRDVSLMYPFTSPALAEQRKEFA